MFDNLINIKTLQNSEIEFIVNSALELKKSNNKIIIDNKTIALMFFENSTRTKISFEMAAKNLGIKVIHFDTATSSLNKGESLKETLENLYYIGVNAVVIRTSDDKLFENLIKELKYPIRLINAGAGKTSHPTQALLDYVTMIEKMGTVKNKKITIVGDIEHSRVAKSNIELLERFGAKLTTCSPEYFRPSQLSSTIRYTSDLKDAITSADVIMGLRIQRERIAKAYNEVDYIKNYRLNNELIKSYAPNAMIMHPGPVNRNVEITSELLDSNKGTTILEQARNGVFTRMAILNAILGEEQ